MRQPEAKFKAKLIQLYYEAVDGRGWHTYLSPGGPGQRPGLPDLIFGDPIHGVVWVEAKVGPRPKTRKLQLKTLAALAVADARVCVPCLDGDHVHLFVLSTDGLVDACAVSLGDALWPAIWEVTL